MLTFDSEGGALGGLADTGEDIELHVSPQSLDQSYGGGALSLSQWGGGDSRGTDNINTGVKHFREHNR